MKHSLPEHIQIAQCGGHQVTSIVAAGEPLQQRQRALSDLKAALPSPEALQASGGSLRALATTPDFHPGKPVPVGVVADFENVVLPHMVGNDIGCGMRMIVLENICGDDLTPGLDRILRHKFFQGGRNVALTGADRHALLREGLPGLLESIKPNRVGLLGEMDLDQAWRDLDRTCDAGVFQTTSIDPGFADYARIDDHHRHDAILGTIGGGNHFVEFGVIERIANASCAYAQGLRLGSVVIVVHSGSLDFGQQVGSTTQEQLRSQNRGSPDWRILAEERHPRLFHRYINGQATAVNAAFVNRFLIGLIAVAALTECTGRSISHRLAYDAPHNAIWETNRGARHRKGACPARYGEPVILPGSMGDGTWLLSGLGSDQSLHSSAHGAGRRLSRQEARSKAKIPNTLRVIGPVDVADPANHVRADIKKEVLDRLREEAPAAYRSIDDVVSPMAAANMVDPVAKIRPLLTIKG